MSIAEDASAPAALTNTANAALTTTSFTPPANSLILAIGNVGNNTGSGTATGTVTDSISSAWTLLKRASAGNGGASEVWAADAGASPAARTVTYTPATGTNFLGNSLCVKVLTGAQPKATCLGASATALNTTAFGIAITPTQVNSLLCGGLVDVIAAGALTVNGVTTAWQSVSDSGDTERYAAFRLTGLTSSLSTQTIGFSNTAADGQNIVAIEILPAGSVVSGGSASWSLPWQPALSGTFGPVQPFVGPVAAIAPVAVAAPVTAQPNQVIVAPSQTTTDAANW